MARLARSASGTTKGNTIVLDRVKVIFQVYPGTGGTDAERAIAAVAYEISIGRAKTIGTTAADGGVELDIPTGSKAKLKIFETEYEIKVQKTLEAETTVKGAKRRLAALGYEHGPINDNFNKDVDRAAANFQADRNLNAEGTFGSPEDFNTATENELKTVFGE